jgi:hypothetical protein
VEFPHDLAVDQIGANKTAEHNYAAIHE